MNFTRNPGLELIELTPDTPLLTSKSEMRRAAKQGDSDNFARFVELDGGTFTYGLKRLLKHVDNEFDVLESATGHPTVKHDWALYPYEHANFFAQRHSGDYRIPKGFVLAAIVEAIRPQDAEESAEETLQTQLTANLQHRYYKNRHLHVTPKLYDIDVHQYTYGSRCGIQDKTGAMPQQNNSPTLYMHDIEPRISRLTPPYTRFIY